MTRRWTPSSPELTRLSVEALEARVLKLRDLRPSDARKQLEALRTTAESWAEDRRGCLYKTALVGTVATEATVFKSSPELWGETREVEELQTLFLELPMTRRWTLAQRKNLLGKVETLFVANLDAREPGDRDYWRRMYLGLLLTCEVTDEALATLRAKRPGSCLGLTPDEG